MKNGTAVKYSWTGSDGKAVSGTGVVIQQSDEKAKFFVADSLSNQVLWCAESWLSPVVPASPAK